MQNPRFCQNEKCATVYDPGKSSSRFLRLTFCSYTCERATNGFLIEDFDYVLSRHQWKNELRETVRELSERFPVLSQ